MHKARLALCVCVAVLAVFTLGCSRDPNVRKQKYMESGKKYFEDGKYREASIQFSNALQIDRRDATAHYELAKTLVKLQSWNNAYRELSITVDLQPDNYPAQLDLGYMLLAGRDPKRAQEKATLILQQQPNNPDAHMLLANCYVAQKDPTKAAPEMRKAIELAPNRAVFYLGLASFQASENQLDEAEKNFQKGIQLDPSSLDAVQALARFYERQQRWPDAEKQLKHGIMLAPKEVAPRIELARLYLATNRRSEAESLMSEAKSALADDPNGYRLLADFYTSTGQTDKALAEFGALQAKHPKDMAVAKSYARLLAATDRYPEAEKINQEVLKANPRDGEGINIQGQLLIRQGHPDQAVRVLESGLKNDADNPLLHYNLGNALAAVGDAGRAETEWREAARLSPSMTQVQQLLAEVSIAKNDAGALKQAAEALIQQLPTSPAGYVYRARAEGMQSQTKLVEQDLQKALEIAPQDPTTVTKLADWRAQNRQFADAEKFYERALASDPNYVPAMKGLLGLYVSQKRSAAALQRLDEQLDKAPNNSSYHQLKGVLLASNKDYNGAAVELRKAIDLDKKNNDATILLAQVEAERAGPNKAIAGYEQAIQQNPRDMRAYFMLGLQYERVGNWQKAEEMYRKVLEIQPDQPLANNNLAYLMLEHGGNVDVALSLAQIARRGQPDQPTTADTLAWAYYKKGAYSSAIGLLEDAAKQSPNSAAVQYHLGMAYRGNKDAVKARIHLERALQLDPKFAAADDARKELSALGTR